MKKLMLKVTSNVLLMRNIFIKKSVMTADIDCTCVLTFQWNKLESISSGNCFILRRQSYFYNQ